MVQHWYDIRTIFVHHLYICTCVHVYNIRTYNIRTNIRTSVVHLYYCTFLCTLTHTYKVQNSTNCARQNYVINLQCIWYKCRTIYVQYLYLICTCVHLYIYSVACTYAQYTYVRYTYKYLYISCTFVHVRFRSQLRERWGVGKPTVKQKFLMIVINSINLM